MSHDLTSALAAVENFQTLNESSDFKRLLRVAGLQNDEGALRFNDWSAVSFENQDLTGLDFTGALLGGCDFQNAMILGARFDGAVLGSVTSPAHLQADLSRTIDWLDHCLQWQCAPKTPSDMHLDELEYFQDAPFASKMAFLPVGVVPAAELKWGKAACLRERVAVATMPLTALQLMPYCLRLQRDGQSIGRLSAWLDRWGSWVRSEGGVDRLSNEIVPLNWSESDRYLRWLSDETGHTYRRITEEEWEVAVQENVIAKADENLFEWTKDTWTRIAGDGSVLPTHETSGQVARRVGPFGPMSRTSFTTEETSFAALRIARAWVR